MSRLDQKIEVVKAFIEITDLGITENMAKAGVQQNTEFPLDEGDCLLDCIELMENMHEDDDQKICDLAKQFDIEIGKEILF